jgi:Fungal protein kinase
MYSAQQLPGHHTPGTELNAGLQKELKAHVVDTDTNFIAYFFPSTRLPFPIDDALLAKLSTSHTTDAGKIPAIWSTTLNSQRGLPQVCTEQSITDWLNNIGKAMAHASGHAIRRVWSHRNCNKPPDGSNIKRKPDIILIDKVYHSILNSTPHTSSDWNFIQSFCEVTSQEKTSTRITDTINAKSYVLFATQHNRRFVVAMSFTGNGKFRLTVTDREGQVRLGETSLSGKRHNIAFFTIIAFLMFGNDSDIGLDPTIEVDSTGKVCAIVVDKKRFEVFQLIHSVETLIGRATKVWIVSFEGKLYILKDSWIQDSHVESEVSFLERMSVPELEGCVPNLVCGGDIIINGVRDCTGRYRVDLAGYPYSQRVHRRTVSSPIGEPLTTFRSKREFINVMISLLKSKSPHLYSICMIELMVNMQLISSFPTSFRFYTETSVSTTFC